MSFKIARVGYHNFRSMEEFFLDPDPLLTILVGPNAAGKTNCVEGMQILTAGVSFRHASPGDLVRQGTEAALLRMHVEGDKRLLDVEYAVSPHKKLLSINGKRRPNAEGRGILPSILFYPDELLLVKGGATGRRDLMDDFGVQINNSYAKIAHDYRRALVQRNTLLKDAARTGMPFDPAIFDAWTDSLVAAGSMLFLYRASLVMRLAPHIVGAYADLSGGEVAAVGYQSSCGGFGEGTGVPGSPHTLSLEQGSLPARDEVQERFRAQLDATRGDERRRGQTLAGPHLDDVSFLIEGRAARTFGSQGQQRTLVLAVKLAQVALVREIMGQYPVFLLDDVMSELDTARRARLFSLIRGGMQTIVTTTNLEYFGAEELKKAKVVRLGDGAV